MLNIDITISLVNTETIPTLVNSVTNEVVTETLLQEQDNKHSSFLSGLISSTAEIVFIMHTYYSRCACQRDNNTSMLSACLKHI